MVQDYIDAYDALHAGEERAMQAPGPRRMALEQLRRRGHEASSSEGAMDAWRSS